VSVALVGHAITAKRRSWPHCQSREGVCSIIQLRMIRRKILAG
jgi:hypothetical protein